MRFDDEWKTILNGTQILWMRIEFSRPWRDWCFWGYANQAVPAGLFSDAPSDALVWAIASR